MALREKRWKAVDVLKWILIVFLLAACAVVVVGKRNIERERDIAKQEAYIKIYQTQTVEELKRKNKELYDSVTSLNDKKPESAIEIRYRYVTKTDTVTKTMFVQSEDSVYHYVQDNDTVKTEIDVKATNLEWCRTSTEINDKFMIITRRGDEGIVETTISHSPAAEITGVDAWRAKPSFKDRIYIGPSVSAGYGLINRKFDIYVGISVGIKLN